MKGDVLSVDQEFSARIERIRKLMHEQDVEALFLVQPSNVWYVAGFWEFIPIRMEAVLVPIEGACSFVVSKNEFEYANKVSWISDVRYYTEFPERGRHQNPYDMMLEVFREKKLENAKIGIEESFFQSRSTAGFPKCCRRQGSSTAQRFSADAA